MDFIKEYCPGANMIVIRSNRYGSCLSKFLDMLDVAQKDFPVIRTDDVDIKHYAGEFYAKTFGIEFLLPKGSRIPPEYNEIPKLEYTY